MLSCPASKEAPMGMEVQQKKPAVHLSVSVSVSPDAFQSIKPRVDNEQVVSMFPEISTRL